MASLSHRAVLTGVGIINPLGLNTKAFWEALLAGNKMAALLRVANAPDAEHLQKVTALRVHRHAPRWILEIDGTGDLTMEQLAATARADMFRETFGQELTIRRGGTEHD